MGRPCTICFHGDRSKIERQLLQKNPLGDIARRHTVSKDALARHRDGHMQPKTLTIAPTDLGGADFERWRARVKLDTAADVLEFAKLQLYRLERLVDAAQADGDLRTAVTATNATLKTLVDLFAKTTGLLADGPQVDASTKIALVLSNVPEEQLRALIASAAAAAPKAVPA